MLGRRWLKESFASKLPAVILGQTHVNDESEDPGMGCYLSGFLCLPFYFFIFFGGGVLFNRYRNGH